MFVLIHIRIKVFACYCLQILFSLSFSKFKARLGNLVSYTSFSFSIGQYNLLIPLLVYLTKHVTSAHTVLALLWQSHCSSYYAG